MNSSSEFEDADGGEGEREVVSIRAAMFDIMRGLRSKFKQQKKIFLSLNATYLK